VDEGVEVEVRRGGDGFIGEKLGSMQRNRWVEVGEERGLYRMEREGKEKRGGRVSADVKSEVEGSGRLMKKTHKLPQTAAFSVSELRITLLPVVIGIPLLLGSRNGGDRLLRLLRLLLELGLVHIGIGSVNEMFLVIVIFRLGKHSTKAWRGREKLKEEETFVSLIEARLNVTPSDMAHLSEKVKSTADEWRLVHPKNLNCPLDKGRSPLRQWISLHRFEKQVEVHCLFRGRCETGIEERFVEGSEEAVGEPVGLRLEKQSRKSQYEKDGRRRDDLGKTGTDLFVRNDLLDKVESLDGDVEGSVVGDSEEGVEVALEAGLFER
jgi:hypothetical protein